LATTSTEISTVDYRGVLNVHNKNTGQRLWQKKTQNAISAGPVIVNHQAIVCGIKPAQLVAYALKDGAVLWTVPLTGELVTPPSVQENFMVVTTLDGSVSAFTADTGKLLWRYTTHAPTLVLRKNSRPVISKNQVFAGLPNGKVIALQRSTGMLLWEHELTLPRGRSEEQRMIDASADLAMEGNQIFAGSYQGHVVALNSEEGNVIWEHPMSLYSGFSVSDAAIYFTNAKGHIIALNKKTGKILWQQEEREGHMLSAPEIQDQWIVVGDEEGYVHWLSQETGQWVARFLFDSQGIEAKPVVLKDKVYFLGRSGKLGSYEVK
jgi:outer membrane protein assembly factor BamB